MSIGNQPKYDSAEDEAVRLLTWKIAKASANFIGASIEDRSRDHYDFDYRLSLPSRQIILLEGEIKTSPKVIVNSTGFPIQYARVPLRKKFTKANYYFQYICKSKLLWFCPARILKEAKEVQAQNRRNLNTLETFLAVYEKDVTKYEFLESENMIRKI